MIREDIRIDNCIFRLSEHIPLNRLEGICNQEKIIEKEVISVFLHSANYKFSLGSGASAIVKRIIDGEKNSNHKSNLEQAIQKIKKTHVCNAKLTKGGDLPGSFKLETSQGNTHPNFDYIIHAVIPGPRINDFETRIEQLFIDCLELVSGLSLSNRFVDFCLPIMGVNNFNYPFPFMVDMYVRRLEGWIKTFKIHGCITFWIQKGHTNAVMDQLNLIAKT